MKPNMIVGALALTSVFMAGHLQAADGTVHFRGEIIDSTCEVTPETKDQVVDLGKVNRTAFSGVDDVAAPTAFSIDLTQCPKPLSPPQFVSMVMKMLMVMATGNRYPA